jgi:1-acyl-sn-glycerol-3-phosphate acyltransferase
MRTTDFTETLALGRTAPAQQAPGDILGFELPYLGAADRLLLYGMALIASRHVVSIRGLQHILPARDPFILAANHGSLRESVLVPSLLFLHRGGKRIHFLADWNFRIIPGLSLLYQRAGVVTVVRKPARPRVLNVLKALYERSVPPRLQARAHLAAGRSIGIFPEGQVNRHPDQMLRGRHGAARLSLEAGVPVVPMGIRFCEPAPGRPGSPYSAMELVIGAPLVPEGPAHEPASLATVRSWHAVIMTEIARLSGKAWTDEARRGR